MLRRDVSDVRKVESSKIFAEVGGDSMSMNPETLMAEKEKFKCLSQEALAAMQIIMDLPPHIFKKNGTIKISKVKQILSISYKWDKFTIDFAINELKFFTKFILGRN